MHATPETDHVDRLREAVQRSLPRYLADLETLVTIESGSFSKAGVDRVAAWMAERLQTLGATVERLPHAELGDTVVATFHGREEGATVLLIGHMDTVFEDGYLSRRPFEVRDGRVRGPGAGDMKSGLLCGLYALEAIRLTAESEDDWLPVGTLIFIANPDEEIGSPSSTDTIAELARGADAAFVLEGARPNGDLVTERKGVHHFIATLRGRAAHAGVEPEKGRNAVVEAAHKAVAMEALNGRWDSVTVVVGAINGGTRANVVPDEAVMQVDVRAATANELDEAIDAVLTILHTHTIPDLTVELTGGAKWRPMEQTAASTQLFDIAQGVAARLGFELGASATGGGSDANTTAAMGVPSLDGLGPVSGNAHTAEEYIELDSIVPRTTLLAALVEAVGGRA